MKHISTKVLLFLFLIITQWSTSQSKTSYLKDNRQSLLEEHFAFKQINFKIIGFGAYHGSAKTEEAELALLKSLLKQGSIKYYLPETDYSTGHYFNEYLKTGDTILLKQLVNHYGKRVPQERAVEVVKKWKILKSINDTLPISNKLTVVGIDGIVSYPCTAKHLVSFIDNNISFKEINHLQELFQVTIDNHSQTYNEAVKEVLRSFVANYENTILREKLIISDDSGFKHIIKNLKESFEKYNREQLIYDNYIYLSSQYNFYDKPQFLRYGFFHIEKEREYDTASFFTKLIENKVYKRKEVISIIGYLTKSAVLWDTFYDEFGKFKSHTIEKGFGIGDYWKEYFHGIKYLKRNKLSDLTLFRLNSGSSPYHLSYGDLVEVRSILSRPLKKVFKNKTTTNFLDYAVLISNSQANTPLK